MAPGQERKARAKGANEGVGWWGRGGVWRLELPSRAEVRLGPLSPRGGSLKFGSRSGVKAGARKKTTAEEGHRMKGPVFCPCVKGFTWREKGLDCLIAPYRSLGASRRKPVGN